jgi:hypothetical protein|tara:strand:+ start:273 stop:467 length:195 start_codon:yes stop_codon:yes gene_type:complete
MTIDELKESFIRRKLMQSKFEEVLLMASEQMWDKMDKMTDVDICNLCDINSFYDLKEQYNKEKK